jgi:hypothetical protein
MATMKRATLSLAIIFAVLWVMLVGCKGAPSRSGPTPTFIRHPRPNLTVDQAIYENLGCPPDGYCEGNLELARVGCERLMPSNALLGGLAPSYPIAECSWRIEPTGTPGVFQGRQGLYRTGRMYIDGDHTYANHGFVVLRDGSYQMAASVEDLQALYAPIESEDEAFSYAIAATGFWPQYFYSGFPSPESDTVLLTNQLEESYVTQQEDGYTVLLYQTDRWSTAGHHPTWAFDVLVTADGRVSISGGVKVHQNRLSRETD